MTNCNHKLVSMPFTIFPLSIRNFLVYSQNLEPLSLTPGFHSEFILSDIPAPFVIVFFFVPFNSMYTSYSNLLSLSAIISNSLFLSPFVFIFTPLSVISS